MNGTQPPTTAGTWAPDWRTLKKARDRAIVNIPYANDDQFNEAAYGAIVSEYQRQSAAAGFVLVSATDLRVLLDHFTGYGDADAEACKARLNAATPELTPGGDAG